MKKWMAKTYSTILVKGRNVKHTSSAGAGLSQLLNVGFLTGQNY
jgi:hypothetical protein